ncbi:hypothetical protein M0R45_026012 [Rubus argutus]|uniref:Uncharacterized protein n=1 Tax=Rubus argutus TaxID=59490 RepID=A0AAW1WVP8_RUBAR
MRRGGATTVVCGSGGEEERHGWTEVRLHSWAIGSVGLSRGCAAAGSTALVTRCGLAALECGAHGGTGLGSQRRRPGRCDLVVSCHGVNGDGIVGMLLFDDAVAIDEGGRMMSRWRSSDVVVLKKRKGRWRWWSG